MTKYNLDLSSGRTGIQSATTDSVIEYGDFYGEEFYLITDMPSNFNYTDCWLGLESGEGAWRDGEYCMTSGWAIDGEDGSLRKSGVRPVIVIDKNIVGV